MKGLLALAFLLVAGLGVLFWTLGKRGDGGSTSEAPRPGAVAPTAEAPADIQRADPPSARRTEDTPRVERTAVESPEASTRPRRSTSAEPTVQGMVVGDDGPVPNATIQVVNMDDDVLGVAETDGRGNFQAKLVAPAESASLRVIAYGYSPMEVFLRRIRAGENRNIGNLRLQKGKPLEGRVIDASERPVDGADVSVLSVFGNTPSQRPLLAAHTGPDGAFRFEDAPAGRVRLVAEAEGHGSRAIEIPGGSLGVVLQLVESARLNLIVRDTRGKAVSGASVSLRARDRFAPNQDGATDGEGRLSFRDLGATEWDVRVLADGYRPASLGGVRSGPIEVEIEIQPWPCLVGRVVALGGEQPPKGTTVVAVPAAAGGRRVRSGVEGRPVAADGTFRLCDLRPGDYIVRVEAPGFAPTHSQTVRVGLDLDGTAGTLLLETGGSIEIFTVSEDQPVINAKVEMHLTAPPRALLWNPTPTMAGERQGGTDAMGTLKLDNVEPGAVWFIVRSARHLPRLVGPIEVANGQHVRPEPIELESGARIVGRVLDQNNVAQPFAMVLIQGVLLPSGLQVTTDSEGHFTSPPLPTGSYQLRARGNRGSRSMGRPSVVEVKSGTEKTIDLIL